MRRLLILIALVAGTLVPATSAFGAPSAADKVDNTGIGIRLVDAPVAARDNPRARVYIIDHLAPGTKIERRVEVSNNTGHQAEIAVYAAAATTKAGAFVGLAGDTPNALSTWTTVGSPRVRLLDGAKKIVNVKIDVPDDAPPGEQYAVLWAQTTSGAKGGGGVTQVSRVGIRVYLSVGPGGEPASAFKIESLTSARDSSGAPMVMAKVHNTGGRALDLGGTLKLTGGPGGLAAGPFPVTLGTTLGTGQSENVMVKLDKRLPAGPWDARLEVTSGLQTESARATITFPKVGTGETVTVSGDTNVWWWIGGGLVLVIVLITALFWWLLVRRRRGTESASRTQVEARIAP